MHRPRGVLAFLAAITNMATERAHIVRHKHGIAIHNGDMVIVIV